MASESKTAEPVAVLHRYCPIGLPDDGPWSEWKIGSGDHLGSGWAVQEERVYTSAALAAE